MLDTVDLVQAIEIEEKIPLKQGLKRTWRIKIDIIHIIEEKIPLKQGLKRTKNITR